MATLRAGIDARGATVGAAEFRRATGSMTRSGSGVTSMLTRLGGAIGATFLLRSMIRNVAEGEHALAQLRAGLKSTAGRSGQTEASLVALSDEMQRTTKFSNDLVNASSAVMLSFTKISGDVFPRAIKVAADVATRMGTDLQGAVVQLAKALDDPIKNLSALSRTGIGFTKVQADIIKALWETGEQAKAQGIILTTIEAQYGGSAPAAMKTLGGSIKALQNSWSDLQKEMGKSAAPGLTAGFKAIAKTLSQSQEAFDALAVPLLVFYKDLENAGRIIGISVGAAWNTVEVSVIKGAKAAVDALVYLQHAKEEFVGGEPSTFYLGLLETQRDLKVAVMDAESAMKDEGSMLDQIIASNETYRESIANIYEGEQQLFRQRAEAAAAASAAPTTPEDPEAAAAAVEKALANAKVVEDALADANDAAYEKELDATDEHFKRIETSRKQHTKNQISIAQGWMSYLVQATAEGAKQNREMFEANKALSMANIVVSTASGIMRAWMDLPWYAALPMTGIIAAAGISQLATVQATKFGGGGGSISSGGGGAGGVGGGGTSASGGGGTGGGGRDVNLTIVGDSVSTEQVREIMERISEESDDGTRIRVNE